MTDTLMPESPPTTALARVEASSPMALILMAAAANADPARLEKLMELQERWERNESAKSFAVAITDFQRDCPQIQKKRGVSMTGGNHPDYLYAGLDDIMAIISPILARNGLSVSFSANLTTDGKLTADCTIRHGMHVEKSSVTLPVPSQMRVNDTQKMGAAFSYAKRYALCAALNITVTNEDVDAKGLKGNPITDQQASALQGMIDGYGVDAAKFLAWAGVARLEDLPASRYEDAHRLLKAKAPKGSAA